VRPAGLAFTLLLASCHGVFRFADDAGHACPASGCPAGLHCSAALGTCVECASPADCPAGHCDARIGRCVQCLTHADCDGGLCEPTTRHCQKPCADGGDCPGMFCVAAEGSRVCGCRREEDCRGLDAGLRKCDEQRWACVQCSEDEHCSPPLRYCDRVTGTCRACVGVLDCPPAFFCSAAGACTQ
jgi:hypothetical protein